MAHFTRFAEGLQKPQSQLLPGHLNEPQARNLGDLVLRAISSQALHQSLQNEVTVGFENHVDEVDDDNSADITQAKLANDFLRGFEVVLRDGLLEVPPRADKLSSVHIDDRHRFRAVNHQRTAAGQPDLPIQCFGNSFVHAVLDEGIRVSRVLLHARNQIGSNLREVLFNRLGRV